MADTPPDPMTSPTASCASWAWQDAAPAAAPGERLLPEEVPVALTYGRATQAVMMATPADLEDFGIGFSLTEGLVARPEEITALEVRPGARGIELRMELTEGRQAALLERRRFMAGPVGCGLCGLDSLEAALRPLPPVPAGPRLPGGAVGAALSAMAARQALHRATQGAHAAGFWHPARGLLVLREDVGRHNALDKLVGALRRAGLDPAEGAVVMTSRVSVELVQKTALLGAAILVAVSAPTALAVRSAEACGLTLIARARAPRFEVFCHGHRLVAGEALPEAAD
ncbi:formate dehydrogenase accessory sulfurtransferase FdhD [Roseomonas sp. USHLN139]|uniref:formate dehydrogenase accessory sulfurtransferase FdhD n=1 Tax=Roseomonas sp. USHLN139 TaxID=3081298 RepID=UPI003B011A61